MTEVRLSIRALKQLFQGEKLPPTAMTHYKSASSAVENSLKFELLHEAIEVSCKELALIRDARSRFASGLPDQHKASTQKLGMAIYEARDAESPAWRGALIRPKNDKDVWLVHADRHDQFHRTCSDVLNSLKTQGRLGPTALDEKIRKVQQARLSDRETKIAILQALIEALQKTLNQRSPTTVAFPPDGKFHQVRMTLEIDSLNTLEWETENAHKETEILRIELELSSLNRDDREWLIGTCVSFLQPDPSMVDTVYLKELVVSILINRANLIQLLAGAQSELPISPTKPPAPTTLHYTSKASLTDAYVNGNAVRAVCGEWWVPVGDEMTHSHLAICPACEREEPFAQLISDCRQ